MEKRKLVKILIGAVILVILSLIISVFNSFYGNPISASIATHKIQDYVKDTYPDMDLVVSKAKYNFKFSAYSSRVESLKSLDTKFSVGWSKGRISDDYEYEVKNHFTTYRRLQEELTNKFEEILEREFPYDTSIAFMDLTKDDSDLSQLQLDMSIDMSNPPVPTTVTVYILTDEVTYDFLTERLMDLARIMEKYAIHVDYYSVVLEPKNEGQEKPAPGKEKLYLYDFPAENLKQQELIPLIEQHQSDWEKGHEK